MRSWVTVIQSLTPISWPTSGCSSAMVSKVLMRAAASVDPRDDGLPLLAVALEACRRDVPQRQAVGGEVDVVLRVAQEAEQRHVDALQERAQLVGQDRALAGAHADHGRLHLGAAPMREQLVDEFVRRVDVEDARLERDQDLVGELHHLVEALAVQAGGRVEDDVGRSPGRADDVAFGDLPGGDPRQPFGTQAQPGARRLLPVDVAEHHGVAARREVAREVRRQRRLADASLGIGDHDHRHAALPSRFTGMLAPALPCNFAAPAGFHRAMASSDSPAALADAAPTSGADILVIVAHPELEQSRANRRLLEAARALQRELPASRLAVRDLYALYPDYLIDVAVEQAAR